jgi:hypothetical protein
MLPMVAMQVPETILPAQKRFATVLLLIALQPHGSTGSP